MSPRGIVYMRKWNMVVTPVGTQILVKFGRYGDEDFG